MSAVAGHQLDHEPSVLLGVVASTQKLTEGGIDLDVVVEIAVLLDSDLLDGSADALAAVEDGQSLRVIDTGERILRGWTERTCDRGGATPGAVARAPTGMGSRASRPGRGSDNRSRRGGGSTRR
jgi:hypothetical protein